MVRVTAGVVALVITGGSVVDGGKYVAGSLVIAFGHLGSLDVGPHLGGFVVEIVGLVVRIV